MNKYQKYSHCLNSRKEVIFRTKEMRPSRLYFILILLLEYNFFCVGRSIFIKNPDIQLLTESSNVRDYIYNAVAKIHTFEDIYVVLLTSLCSTLYSHCRSYDHKMRKELKRCTLNNSGIVMTKSETCALLSACSDFSAAGFCSQTLIRTCKLNSPAKCPG